MGKRGQLKLSFGMIFSIILIVIFIAVAFYAIVKFLDIKETTEIAKFKNDLQEDIDKMWKGSQGSQTNEYFISSKITHLCLIDYSSEQVGKYSNVYDELKQFYYENENFFFYPLHSAQGNNGNEMKHIDLEKITENENPYCISSSNGKFSVTIKKNFGEALVTIE